jgi:nucleoside 2-deoxyribosyltransferase
MTVSIYLASRYGRREEMEEIALLLMNAHGYDITARWVFGGEEGLTREDIALLDIEDVDKADTIVAFTEPYGTMFKGGGRYVELGYALAKNKRCVIIGERENVFCDHPHIEQFDTLAAWLQSEIGIKIVSA